MRRLFRILKSTFELFEKARVNLLSAAISFYAIFSLAPIAVIAVAVAGLVLEDETLRAQIETYVAAELGDEPARLLGEMMERTANPGAGGLVASIIGIALLLYASTRLFIQFQRALDQIWDHHPKITGGIGKHILWILEKRLLSFGLVLILGMLLITSVIGSTAISAASDQIGKWILLPGWITRSLEMSVTTVLLAGLFGLIFKILPDADVSWLPALYGGAVAAVLFTLGRLALGYYFGHFAVVSEYGAAGSLVLLILWIYYSAQVIFLGATFSRVITEQQGDRERLEVRSGWRFLVPPAWRRRDEDKKCPSNLGVVKGADEQV